tara:strand:- start:54 stop:515 length:462 start_codon:yes stop_codon:yes gene_type:complete
MHDDACSPLHTCFVCLQEGGEEEHGTLARVCKCNTYVHAACFHALTARVPSHATACPVCRTAYALPCQRDAEEDVHPPPLQLSLVPLLTVSALFAADVVLLHMTTAIPWHVCLLLSSFCTLALSMLRCTTAPPSHLTGSERDLSPAGVTSDHT